MKRLTVLSLSMVSSLLAIRSAPAQVLRESHALVPDGSTQALRTQLADVDADGWLDLMHTPARLMRGRGDGGFESDELLLSWLAGRGAAPPGSELADQALVGPVRRLERGVPSVDRVAFPGVRRQLDVAVRVGPGRAVQVEEEARVALHSRSSETLGGGSSTGAGRP